MIYKLQSHKFFDNEDEKHELYECKQLEKRLLFHYKERTKVNLDLEQIKYNNFTRGIYLVRDGKSLIKNHNKNIQLRNYYTILQSYLIG
jgi:hypothetical protein